MDTSDQYINMCTKASLIQRKWKPLVGDWYYEPRPYNYREPGAYMLLNLSRGFQIKSRYSTRIWLPTLHQLRQMYNKKQRVDEFINDLQTYNNPTMYQTLEQQTLAMYMHTRHKKSWGDGKWIR